MAQLKQHDMVTAHGLLGKVVSVEGSSVYVSFIDGTARWFEMPNVEEQQ